MDRKKIILFVLAGTALAALLIVPLSFAESSTLSPVEKLGKMLYYDTNLSEPRGEACAACHDPSVGFTGPNVVVNATGGVYPGAIPSRYGNRKPPASSYAGDSPILYFDEANEAWTGGMFWDGRATGATLGDPLAEQAEGPFLNPMEQNIPNTQVFCQRVKTARYAHLFKQAWKDVPLSCDTPEQVQAVYVASARAIAAFERSSEVSPFTSKYDYYLKGMAKLTTQEKMGLELFDGKAMCSGCHISEATDGQPPLFTDYTYDNLGVPRNPLLPFYYELWANPQGTNWVDPGLGGYLKSAGYDASVYETEMGKFKVLTLRNVDERPYPWFVKAYGHNGYFKSLDEIVHFYNTRDILPTCAPNDPGLGTTCWPAAEMSANMNTIELGNLGLTQDEEAAIVAFLKTLTDGYYKLPFAH